MTPQLWLAVMTILAIWSFVLFAGYDVDNAVTALVGILTGMGLESQRREREVSADPRPTLGQRLGDWVPERRSSSGGTEDE